MVTDFAAVTDNVVTGNFAVVAPAVIVNAVTLAAGSLLVRPMTTPPAGAASLNVNVPTVVAPPCTVAEATVTLIRAGTVIIGGWGLF